MRIMIPLLILVAGCGCGSGTQDNETAVHSSGDVRPAAVAGSFYPGDSLGLAGMVDSLLASSAAHPAETGIVAGVVPHAGYVFSGATAASFYRAIQGEDFDVVVLVGPSHHVAFNGFSIFDGNAYTTPLGEVPVDREMAERLIQADPAASFIPAAHEAEHCIEVQLPFLQEVLAPGFKIVPVVVGNADPDQLEFMAELIMAEAYQSRILVIASSDLAHYPTEELARSVDSITVNAISEMKPIGFLQATSPDRMPPGLSTFACGRLPIALVMFYANLYPDISPELLASATSADYSGDESRVVGYAAVAFDSPQPDPSVWSIDEQSAARLMELARESVRSAVTGSEMAEPADLPRDLLLPRGVFVTLKENGQLRGCIGSLRASRPLAENVISMAKSAATEDPRFQPVTEQELDALDYEISVLTPLQILEDPFDVRVGTDGLVIVGPGGRSGVLLPQVPVEQGWNREEFLRGVCMKAGLDPNAYTGDVVLYRFQAQIIHEDDTDSQQQH